MLITLQGAVLSRPPWFIHFGSRDGKCLTFTVSEREDLWRVVLQGARAQVRTCGRARAFAGRMPWTNHWLAG